MKNFKIAAIEGDGVGQEVVPAGKRVLDALAHFEWTDLPWGSAHYFAQGRMAPENFLDTLANFDAIFLGAVGHPEIPDHVTLNGLLLPIRRRFDQYANIRPAILYPGVRSPLALRKNEAIDMIVVRENTEGEYAQIGGFVYQHQPDEVAVQTSVFTRRGCDRIIRYAFELARKRDRKRVASITKSNAQGYSMVLWDRAFAAMNFIRRPESFDVVVASNLFGDILSDISAILVGSMGLAPSANIDPTHRAPSMFEPVHGSAPDIAGKGIVNPLATLLCAAQMLEHLGLQTEAQRLHHSIREVLANPVNHTADLGGKATTAQVTEAVLASL